jgi:hypothetical protein
LFTLSTVSRSTTTEPADRTAKRGDANCPTTQAGTVTTTATAEGESESDLEQERLREQTAKVQAVIDQNKAVLDQPHVATIEVGRLPEVYLIGVYADKPQNLGTLERTEPSTVGGYPVMDRSQVRASSGLCHASPNVMYACSGDKSCRLAVNLPAR